MSEPDQLQMTEGNPLTFRTTATEATSPRSMLRPETTRLRTSRRRCPRRKLSRCRPARRPRVRPRNLKQRQPHLRRLAANEVAAAVANPRRKNRRRESRNPPQSSRPRLCELSSTSSENGPFFISQPLQRAFTPRRLRTGSGAARLATMVTTSSGKALRGDFTNTANQRSTRPIKNSRTSGSKGHSTGTKKF